ncbi:DMT family transporter [uncultured Sphaerochaeta sp.]|uniref:DMT family transporter n=1 Tax=uncultured Sphaerochaeta sp. TaxID=886478 RepID=UPI002A0A321E|nr:DMT family transporter [uncultured Sphaerochaeta sp.]
MNEPTIESLHKGMLFLLASAFCFALVNVGIRMSGDLPFLEKCFFRNIVALFVAYIMLRRKGISLSPALFKPNFWLLLVRASTGTLGMICNFYAVDHLLLGDASMLAKMSPFFAVLFSAWFLREKVRLSQILCVLGAFFGSLFIIKPSFSNLLFTPSVVGFIGGIGSGAAYTTLRSLGRRGEKGVVIVFFFSLVSTLVTLPSIIFAYVSMDLVQLGWLLCTGIMAALGQFSVTAAYKYAPANKISVYDYSNVLFSALFGFLVFSQIPDRYSILGYLIVFGMGFCMFLINKKNQPQAGLSPQNI